MRGLYCTDQLTDGPLPVDQHHPPTQRSTKKLSAHFRPKLRTISVGTPFATLRYCLPYDIAHRRADGLSTCGLCGSLSLCLPHTHTLSLSLLLTRTLTHTLTHTLSLSLTALNHVVVRCVAMSPPPLMISIYIYIYIYKNIRVKKNSYTSSSRKRFLSARQGTGERFAFHLCLAKIVKPRKQSDRGKVGKYSAVWPCQPPSARKKPLRSFYGGTRNGRRWRVYGETRNGWGWKFLSARHGMGEGFAFHSCLAKTFKPRRRSDHGTTQGSSWGYLKVNSAEILSIFGEKCPQNGSKNDLMAPRMTLECPHEGPSVDFERQRHWQQPAPGIVDLLLGLSACRRRG